MWKFSLLLSLLAASSTKACSISCVTPTTPLVDLLSHDVTVKVKIGNEIDQPGVVVDPRLPWDQIHYYRSAVTMVFKGDYPSGRIIVRTNNNCGDGLRTQTTYLMFGSIQYEEVPGYIGRLPVFVMAGGCVPNLYYNNLSVDVEQQLKAYKETGEARCLPSDCPQNVAFLPEINICPDLLTISPVEQSCKYSSSSNTCKWDVSADTKACPACSSDNDCTYDKNLGCNKDGLCEARL